jgi:hypothetical protein
MLPNPQSLSYHSPSRTINAILVLSAPPNVLISGGAFCRPLDLIVRFFYQYINARPQYFTPITPSQSLPYALKSLAVS